MTNKEMLEKEIQKQGYTLGCYNKKLDQLTKKELSKVLNNIELEYTDIEVNLNKQKHIVEISTIDSEKDFNILSKSEYYSKYGNNK